MSGDLWSVFFLVFSDGRRHTAHTQSDAILDSGSHQTRRHRVHPSWYVSCGQSCQRRFPVCVGALGCSDSHIPLWIGFWAEYLSSTLLSLHCGLCWVVDGQFWNIILPTAFHRPRPTTLHLLHPINCINICVARCWGGCLWGSYRFHVWSRCGCTSRFLTSLSIDDYCPWLLQWKSMSRAWNLKVYRLWKWSRPWSFKLVRVVFTILPFTISQSNVLVSLLGQVLQLYIFVVWRACCQLPAAWVQLPPVIYLVSKV